VLGAGSNTTGLIVKARALLDGASLGPDALKAVGQAFDETWAEIANHFARDATQLEGARLMLASALLSIADDASRDVAVLKKAALRVAAQNYASWSIGVKIETVTDEALTVSFWRSRADDARRLAQSVADPLIKRELIDIAYGYERIAKMAGDQKARAAK